MSVLFAEMDRSGPVGSVAMNGGCGSSIHNQQPQSQSSSSASSTNSVTAAAVAAAAVAANSLEEQRALQLAFELSMLGLSDSMPGCNSNGGHVGSDLNVNIGLNSVNSGCHQSPSSLSPGGSANGGINSVMTNNVGMSAFSSMMPNMEDRSKKSQNMTECVPVPSSEHVAEIVGRQGKYFVSFIQYKLYIPFTFAVPLAPALLNCQINLSDIFNQCMNSDSASEKLRYIAD